MTAVSLSDSRGEPIHFRGARTHYRLLMRTLTRARAVVSAIKERPRLRRSLEAVAALVVIAVCAYAVKDEWSKAEPQLANARPIDLTLALATVAVYYLVFIFGWIRILASWAIKVPYRAALQAEMASMLAKYIPGGVWTPAARVAALERLTGETATATILASILVEAILSAISGIVVFVISLTWVRNADAPLIPIVLFTLVCVAILHPRIFRPLTARLLKPFGLPPLEPLSFPTMAVLFGFYCCTWLIGGLGLYFLIRSLGSPVHITTVPFLGGTAAIGAIVAVLAIFAPSGLGVREASMYALLIAITSDPTALGATILNRLTITVVELGLFLVGIVIWRLGRPREGRQLRIPRREES
jgi:glycosyltransferase 2 family protein